jgi:hypothetical protein
MTIEYMLLLVVALTLSLKVMVEAPARAFREAAPRLAIRVENQLITGNGFVVNGTATLRWE